MIYALMQSKLFRIPDFLSAEAQKKRDVSTWKKQATGAEQTGNQGGEKDQR